MKKSPTGIAGLDSILYGGLPSGRATIVTGGPGSGKTMMGMQFLLGGARNWAENGLMIGFDESPSSLQARYPALAGMAEGAGRGRVFELDGRMPDDVVEAGAFDLGGLIAIATALVERHDVKRLVIDAVDALFALSDQPANRRRETLRLLKWIADLKVTTILTLQRTDALAAGPAFFELAEYAADGAIQLRSALVGELSRRTLSVVKTRGTGFSEGAHPYIITDEGLRVLYTPTSTDAIPEPPDTHASTGVERLDRMLLGGYRMGTTTLISGLPGTSKTTLAAAFLEAGCRVGEPGLFIGFDEPASQVVFDLRSVGLDLTKFVQSGLLHMVSFAAGSAIAEAHFLAIEELFDLHQPKRVVIDPLTALEKAGGRAIADTVMERLVWLLKWRGITAIFTAIADSPSPEVESTTMRVSTIADTWMHLSFANRGGERNRTLTIVKARGTAHSNQMRELLLSADGIDLADVYATGGEVLVGTARVAKVQQEVAETEAQREVFTAELARLDRSREELAVAIQEAQRGIEKLVQERAKLVDRTKEQGSQRAREAEVIRSKRSGDEPDV